MNRKVKPHIVGLFLAPGLIMWIYFVLVPMLRSFYISLTDWNGFSAEKVFIGLKNYAELLKDPSMKIAVVNTLYFTVLGGVIVFALAIWFAYLMSKKGFKAKNAFSNFFYFPNMISPSALAVLWVFFFNTSFGLMDIILQKVGLGAWCIPWLGSRWSALTCIAVVSSFSNVGYYGMLILSGINRIPPTYLEAAAIDGAGSLKSFIKITLPLLRPVLVISVSMWIINSIKYFELVWAMFHGQSQVAHTMATYMYTLSFGQQVPIFRLGYGSAIAVIMFLIVIVSVGLFRAIFDREDLQY